MSLTLLGCGSAASSAAELADTAAAGVGGGGAGQAGSKAVPGSAGSADSGGSASGGNGGTSVAVPTAGNAGTSGGAASAGSGGKGTDNNGGSTSVGGTSPSSAGGPPATVGEWKLQWSDEFNGTGAINTADWGFEMGQPRNQEPQYFTNRLENVRQENGMLVIEARKESYMGAAYTAASIHTRGKHEFLYGRIEARAQLPGGRGTWPAIWMLGIKGGWPQQGEIDIMENVGFEQNTIHSTVHTGADPSGNNNGILNVPNPHQTFHVYAVEWFEDHLDFFVDDTKTFTYKNDGKNDSNTWPFSVAEYLIIGMAVGGSWGGQQGIDDTIFPVKYYIDYVRYYKK